MTIPFLQRLRRNNGRQPQDFVVIVSGLPRSGTSMMMKALEAGGVPIMTDHERSPDEDNPKGYYEYERVKKLKDGDTVWVKNAQGKAVKAISALLEYLPATHHYKVIFMRRDLAEVLASQREMMVRRGEDPDKVGDTELSSLFHQHLAKVEAWMAQKAYLDVLYVSYNEILSDPEKHFRLIQMFLGIPLDVEKMLLVVDKNLYRQRFIVS